MDNYSEYPRAKFIRLDNGDDLIAEVVEVGDDDNLMYHLYHPLKVVYIPSEKSGFYSIAFMPWVFPKMVETQEFTLQSEKIMIITDVSEKTNINYWESVNEYLKYNDTSKEELELTEEQEDSISKALNEFAQKRIYH